MVRMAEVKRIGFLPQLIVTLRPGDGAADDDPAVLAADVLNFVDALSGVDQVAGGGGLRVGLRRTVPDGVRLSLFPVRPEGAAERIDEIAADLAKLTAEPPAAGDPPASLAAALERVARSPLDRVRVELARRAWAVDVRVEHVARA